eukprot:RCo026162
MKRKLASVQLVKAVEGIANADSLETLRVLGWAIVARKGEFQVGDKVVYCEVDSLLPERPEFEFLRKTCFIPARAEPPALPAGFRIRTVKLRGQVSQGLALPLTVLPPCTTASEIGEDVTEALGVCKWK